MSQSTTDSLTVIDIIDTIMNGVDYELSHLKFDKLSFEDEQGKFLNVNQLEIRQTLRK